MLKNHIFFNFSLIHQPFVFATLLGDPTGFFPPSFFLWHFKAIKKLAYLRILYLTTLSLLYAHQKGWVPLWIVWVWILKSSCEKWNVESNYSQIEMTAYHEGRICLNRLGWSLRLWVQGWIYWRIESMTAPGVVYTWNSILNHINRRVRSSGTACWQHKMTRDI